MTIAAKKTDSAAELRRKAELKIVSQLPDDKTSVAEPDVRKLLHELQVYQAELQMQNEELQQTGNELQIVNSTLEEQVADRTRELSETVVRLQEEICNRKKVEQNNLVLQQQFQQAQRVDSLGVLAGGIAHDFNNILAIIMGYCGLTRLDYDTAEKHIPQIEIAVERAAGLCRLMLAYAGKATLSVTQIVMWSLVEEVVYMLKTIISQNVEIKTFFPAHVPTIRGDASQLKQVVMNLLLNASEAIGEAQGVVLISLSKAVIEPGQSGIDYFGNSIAPGGYLVIEVNDNGCGMNEETRRRIFEPFYTTKFTGRGLGLSAVLGIIAAHKGALQLASLPDHGTTFKVYLPAQVITSAEEDRAPQTAEEQWKGNGTILLAEDEVQVALTLKAMLEELGFNVITAPDGKKAVELYQKNAAEVTLVVTDIGMPIMNGYELFQELKKINPKLPIIISSGFGDKEVAATIPRDAIAGLVSKPYRLDALKNVLKGVAEDMPTKRPA